MAVTDTSERVLSLVFLLDLITHRSSIDGNDLPILNLSCSNIGAQNSWNIVLWFYVWPSDGGAPNSAPPPAAQLNKRLCAARVVMYN